jgi:hypothetical protein
MVEIRTPRLVPQAREAAPIGNAASEGLAGLSRAMQRTADSFSDFYEAEAARRRELIVAETQSEFAQRLERTARDAGDGYAASMLAEFDQYRAQRMQSAPERGRADLEQAMNLYRVDLDRRAQSAELAARQRRAAAAQAAAETARRNALAAEVRLAQNGLIREPSEEVLARMVEQYPDQADEFVRTYNAARMMTDPMAVVEEVQAGRWDAHYTPSQLLNVLEAGAAAQARMDRERESAVQAALSDLNDQVSEETAYIEANGFAPDDSFAANPDALDTLLADLVPDEERRAAVRREVDEQFEVARVTSAVTTAAPDEINAAMERLVARVREPGRTEADVAELNRYTQAVARREQAITEDAAGYAVRINDEVGTLLNAVGGAPDAETAGIAARQYAAARDAEYNRLGVPQELRRAMPVSVAQGIVQSLMQEGLDTLPLRLREIAQTWNDPRVVSELMAQDLPGTAAVAMRYADNPGLATGIIGLAGQSREDLARGLTTTTVSDVTAGIVSKIATYRQAFESGDQTGAARALMDQHFQVAERLALSYVRQGATATTAVDRVMAQMFPETPVVATDRRVLIPADTNSRLVEMALSRAGAAGGDLIRAFNPEPFYDPAFPEFANREIMISAAQGGVWLNNSTGTGAVLAIDLGGFYLPIRNAQGQYYEIDYYRPSHLYDMMRLNHYEEIDAESGPFLFDIQSEFVIAP